MPITMKDVRAYLDPDEVDYASAKKLGPAALPFLLELVHGGDLGLASKATYLASLIKGEQSAAVLEAAARSKEPLLRVAAASGLGNLPTSKAAKVMELLINDSDAGIRKVVVNSAARLKSPQLVAKLQQMAEKDPEPFVREQAARTMEAIKREK